MAPSLPRSLLHYLCGLVLFAACAQALKFDLIAAYSGSARERCIRNFVAKDTLVVVTAIVSGEHGDGMVVNMNVRNRPRPRGTRAMMENRC